MLRIFSFKLILLLAVYIVGTECQKKRPNIVLFLTDDQDLTLGGMTPMKNVQKLIADQGAVFVNSFVAAPVCCPSRATILSGMYPHNHGTFNNSISGGCYGSHWKSIEKITFPAVLKEGGYETFYAGKYLNQYGTEEAGGPSVVPPAWNEWHGLVGNSVYYSYTLSSNGVPTFSANLYLTDIIRDLAVNYIENQVTEDQPFLMVLAPPAPHAPFTPAPRHRNFYGNVTAHKGPNFNIKAEGKHWLMNMPPSPLPESEMEILDLIYRSRWETLLAVDDMVAAVIQSLESAHILDNTYVFYTSDNGYHVGQFSQVSDKRQPYESDVRVPLAVKGPGIQRKTLIYDPTVNVDLAPTIVNLAGLEIPKTMDGVSLNFEKRSKKQFRERHMLVEYTGEGDANRIDDGCPWIGDNSLTECHTEYACKCQDSRNNTYSCVRHVHPNIDFKYCMFNDTANFEEMYNLKDDPYELTNIIHQVFPGIKAWYRAILSQLVKCKGITCNQSFESMEVI